MKFCKLRFQEALHYVPPMGRLVMRGHEGFASSCLLAFKSLQHRLGGTTSKTQVPPPREPGSEFLDANNPKLTHVFSQSEGGSFFLQ